MNDASAVMLRPALVADAGEMSDMSRDLIEAGLRWRYTPVRMAALFSERDTTGLVAHDGSRVQGFAIMQFGDAHAHLSLLCVRPALQRQGIGRRLHDWLVESAYVAGIETIRLELRADNVDALAFYQSLGFRETQLVVRYYDDRVAARRMTLALRTTSAG